MTFSLAGVRCLARNVDAADPASPRATSPRSRVEAGPPLPHNNYRNKHSAEGQGSEPRPPTL